MRIANAVSDIGSVYTLSGAAVGIYAIGKITHNEHVRETGMVALEALADAGIVSESLKLATDRFRPGEGAASGIFWPDGRPASGGETELYTTNASFPSGHTTAIWAVTHVLVDETPGHQLAARRAIHGGHRSERKSRVVGRDHFPLGCSSGWCAGISGGRVRLPAAVAILWPALEVRLGLAGFRPSHTHLRHGLVRDSFEEYSREARRMAIREKPT